MLIFNLPFNIYDFVNTDADVAPNSASFMEVFWEDYYDVLTDVYIQEYFGKQTKNYCLINDIFYLHQVLIKIHLVILGTIQEERKTYAEYLEEYSGDCIFKRITCKGINVKPLMIAFDSGYSNINNIPTIELSSDDDYDGGISWYRIPGTVSENDDLKVN